MDSSRSSRQLLVLAMPLLTHSLIVVPSVVGCWLWPLLLCIGLAAAAAFFVLRPPPGGCAWAGVSGTTRRICGPRGLPFLGSLLDMARQPRPHRRLAEMAAATTAGGGLMAMSLGTTRVVVASDPATAREILCGAHFVDRPVKQSARELMFDRAMGFAPQGDYWNRLRRLAARNLFSPRRIAASESVRQKQTDAMLASIAAGAGAGGEPVELRPFLRRASLASIMATVFGYHGGQSNDFVEIEAMVEEGFDLLGAFNWADHLDGLGLAFDSEHIHQRCQHLLPKVKAFVQGLIDQHKNKKNIVKLGRSSQTDDFVDVLLSLEGDDKLEDDDIVAVLWEMIFRGTDTTAILTEWVIAELVLHPEMQSKVHQELDQVVGYKTVEDSDISSMVYLQALVKETLRHHPPGPLLSWARLSTADTTIAGHHIPKGTTGMVNMWSIAHDTSIWSEPHRFNPERFLGNASDFDIRGGDLRLAPFGAGRRICPARVLGLTTVHLWVARILQEFEWKPSPRHPVQLQEVLRLSSQMETPLIAMPVVRNKQKTNQ